MARRRSDDNHRTGYLIVVKKIGTLRVLRRRRLRSTRRYGNRRARAEHSICYNLGGIVEFTAACKIRVIPENFRAMNDVGRVFKNSPTKEMRITTMVPAVFGTDEYFKKA